MPKVPQSMSEGLIEASEGFVHAMMAPDAAPHMQVLTKLLSITTMLAKGQSAQQPGAGQTPGPAGAPGTPGAGPAGGMAANPAMLAMTGGMAPPLPPGAGPGGPSAGIPVPQGDELRRMLAGAAGQ
jgi:hypothetical protein